MNHPPVNPSDVNQLPMGYEEYATKCVLVLTMLTDKASAVWNSDNQVRSSYSYFTQLIQDVFKYPNRGQDMSDSATDDDLNSCYEFSDPSCSEWLELSSPTGYIPRGVGLSSTG